MRRGTKAHEIDPTMHELYQWISSVINIQGVSIQYLSTGIPYCLIINRFYESLLPLIKIKTDAALESDRRANFKLLSESIKKTDLHHIQIETPKLLSASIFEHKKLLMKFHEKLATRGLRLQEMRKAQNQNQTPLKMHGVRTPQSHSQRVYTKQAKPGLSIGQIKEVIGRKDVTDREKVKILKKLLEISDQSVENREINCFNEIKREEESDNLLENSEQRQIIVIDQKD